jgi:putative SOS response-associated peptidase YedK
VCGRFVSSTPVSKLAEQFLVEDVKLDEHEPNWNVAPTNEILAVAAGKEGVRRLGTFKWGLVPSWAKDPTVGNRMINLRAETVSEKPSFRRTLGKHRCIIPVDGFYEWKDMGRGRKKQPFFIRSRDGTVLALAGLWEAWKDKSRPEDDEDAWLRTCTIITTEPNGLLAPIHNRMPVVLPPDTWDTWLDRDNDDVDALAALLKPAPDDLLELYPVGTDVNSVRNNGEQLVAPLEGHELPAS